MKKPVDDVWSQMGRAAMLPGITYAIEMLTKIRAELQDSLGGPAETDTPRKSTRGQNVKAAWDAKSPEEKEIIIAKRVKGLRNAKAKTRSTLAARVRRTGPK